MAVDVRENWLYLARLAEEAERYDEAEHFLKEAAAADAADASAASAAIAAAVPPPTRTLRERHPPQPPTRMHRQQRRDGEGARARWRPRSPARLASRADASARPADRVAGAPARDEAFYHAMKASSAGSAASGSDSVPACASAAPGTSAATQADTSAAAAVASRRLSELLLRFPAASIGGVRWSVLARTYEAVHGECLDVAELGFTSASQAAQALLADLLRPSESSDDGAEEDPLLAVVDDAALASLPGFAGTWPSLYRTLCAFVWSFGFRDDSDGESSPTARSLLLSKVRPLLQEDAGTSRSASDDAAAAALGALLAQLQPLSAFAQSGSRSNAEETGFGFWDDDGSSRKLVKIGHLVKAVLLWRDQRVEWRRGRAAASTATTATSGALDAALRPRLELSFVKAYNNLVLRFVDAHEVELPATSLCSGAGSAEDSRPASDLQSLLLQLRQRRTASSASTDSDVDARASTPPERCVSGARASKWVPVRPLLREREAALSARGSAADVDIACHRRASASKGADCAPAAFWGKENNPFKWKVPATRKLGATTSPAPALAAAAAARGRSLTRSPRGGITRAGSNEAVEHRSSSEPPQPHVQEVFDDPFEPPPVLNPWQFSVVQPYAASSVSTRLSLASSSGGGSVDVEPWKQVFSTLDLSMRSEISSTRAPSCYGPPRHIPGAARARSLSRDAENQMIPTIPVVDVEGAQRSHSQPPQQRMAVELFDNPFEPPPEEQRWPLSPSSGAPEHSRDAAAAAVFYSDVQALVPRAPPTTAAAFRSSSQTLLPASEQRGREGSAEARPQSTPPALRLVEVFDDPYEPPPQDKCWGLHAPQQMWWQLRPQ
eukprot:TRINITY_DN3356_c0_g3_i1.p1 TRINITY_DN3356_c0_g3~~TRINITY_DN3356_c0_g3_i1.p1  ORF type:complete len:895 (-),score=198.54 TRINITY_DN3356_c0_g3_i1:95-2617(-)